MNLRSYERDRENVVTQKCQPEFENMLNDTEAQ